MCVRLDNRNLKGTAGWKEKSLPQRAQCLAGYGEASSIAMHRSRNLTTASALKGMIPLRLKPMASIPSTLRTYSQRSQGAGVSG